MTTYTDAQKVGFLNGMNAAAQRFGLGTALSGAGVGSIIDVSPDGSDTLGNGAPLSPVASLTQAMTLVTSARKIIRMAPGEYVEAAAVAWPTIKEVLVIGAGAGSTVISATGTSVITVTPGVQTGTWTGYLRNLTVDHSAGSSQSGITFNNTAMTKKLLFSINDCEFSADDGLDKSINVATHTDADNAIRIYVTGTGNQVEIGGQIYFNVNNLADRLHCENVWLVGGDGASNGAIATPNVAKEFRLRLFRCIVPYHSGVSGGNSTQVVTSVNSYNWVDYNDITPEVFAKLDTADLIGSLSEVIVD